MRPAARGLLGGPSSAIQAQATVRPPQNGPASTPPASWGTLREQVVTASCLMPAAAEEETSDPRPAALRIRRDRFAVRAPSEQAPLVRQCQKRGTQTEGLHDVLLQELLERKRHVGPGNAEGDKEQKQDSNREVKAPEVQPVGAVGEQKCEEKGGDEKITPGGGAIRGCVHAGLSRLNPNPQRAPLGRVPKLAASLRVDRRQCGVRHVLREKGSGGSPRCNVDDDEAEGQQAAGAPSVPRERPHAGAGRVCSSDAEVGASVVACPP